MKGYETRVRDAIQQSVDRGGVPVCVYGNTAMLVRILTDLCDRHFAGAHQIFEGSRDFLPWAVKVVQ